jgi:hypothetical protein
MSNKADVPLVIANLLCVDLAVIERKELSDLLRALGFNGGFQDGV